MSEKTIRIHVPARTLARLTRAANEDYAETFTIEVTVDDKASTGGRVAASWWAPGEEPMARKTGVRKCLVEEVTV